jgi:hypothetical protein
MLDIKRREFIALVGGGCVARGSTFIERQPAVRLPVGASPVQNCPSRALKHHCKSDE